MNTSAAAAFLPLDRDGIEGVLARNCIGRVAFEHRGEIAIVPIHYVYDNGWIYGRTSAEARLSSAWMEQRRVAFEVDEVRDLFDWYSVVARGEMVLLRKDGPSWQTEEWMRALGLIRRLVPETLREDDPSPFRDVLFRIAVQDATGRLATAPTAAGTDSTARPHADHGRTLETNGPNPTRRQK